MSPRICSVDGCGKVHKANGYCAMHDRRIRVHGSPDLPQKPSVEDRFWAKVDKSGDCWEWTGAKTPAGYPVFRCKANYGHRFAWEMVNGTIPDQYEIDHRCHNTSCVRPEHLRLATRKQNIENHSGPKKNCKSGIRGVTRCSDSANYRARVRHDGVEYHLGRFKDIRDAEAAVLAKRIELHTYNDRDRIAVKHS